MTDPVKEQLSACLDGELPEAELDLLLKQVARDAKLRGAMGRYALIGETLRSQGSMAAPSDFAMKVSAAIANEPESAAPERATPAAPRWLRPAAGFAVAAGVAAIAILALRQPEPPTPATYVADAAAPAAADSSADTASYIVPASTDSSAFVPATRLTNYVVAHSEYSSPLGRRSVLTGVLAAEDATDPDAVDADAEPETTEPETTVVTQP
jgi:negative regulator of sigma E activity